MKYWNLIDISKLNKSQLEKETLILMEKEKPNPYWKGKLKHMHK